MKSARSSAPNPVKRDLLLQAVTRSLFVSGVSGVTLQSVADATGISKRTLYKIFGSRDAFFAEAIEADFNKWQGWFMSAVKERAPESALRLEAFAEVLDIWASFEDFTGCLFARFFLSGEMFPPCIEEAVGQCVETLRSFLAGAMRARGLSSGDPLARVQFMAILLVLGGAGRRLPGAPHRDIREVFQRLPEPRKKGTGS